MVEESDRPGRGEPPEGPRREPGIFAERRALRAADSGDAALVRRAEAAEATVHTLERHVTSLQQRLDEAEQERQRLADLLDAERTVALERESELRRVKQREYAEQQLRVEAEDRLVGADRESRADMADLRERLSASEREAGELSARMHLLQRQLAEAEQSAAAERAAARSLDGELHARLAQLEQRGVEMQARLDAERAAREGSDRLIAAMRDGHRRMESLVEEVRGTVGRLGAAITAAQPAP
ncbi:MAG TPA: hypothetical protein VFW29_11640, partial [Solirubrobacteraceae bacterium]|nr:hypothetical protein [Solirubrobacteraceae bacterium]